MQRRLLRYTMVLTNPELLRRREYMKIAAFVFLLTFLNSRIICNTVHSYRRYEISQGRLELCKLPKDLGPISINTTSLDLEELDEHAFPEVAWGGGFTPRNCIALHKVAIIVPYRNRKQHLPIFLNHMHGLLIKQQTEYRIFIIEQASRYDYFNRGKLLNVGFLESQKENDWQCFIFHDLDLLPLDQRNIYSCPDQNRPRHHAAAIDRRGFRLPYKTAFNGVAGVTKKQFKDVNGFSNTYWGADGENDDMVLRMHSMGYTISRYNLSIARYASLYHEPNPKNKNQRYKWHKAMMEAKRTLQEDGLSTLNYSLKTVVSHRLYTHIRAEIGRSPTYQQLLKILKKFNLQQGGVRQTNMELIKQELVALL